MTIKITNCNNIDSGDISITKNILNIKYGVNGTGKSTIAKAITLSISPDGVLDSLTPFKFIESDDISNKPSVLGLDDFNSVAVFDENYVNQFVFKKDEVIENSFNIFIRNQEYNDKTTEIEGLISGLKSSFEDDGLDKVIEDLTNLSSCFGRSKAAYSAASSIGKGISKGNKIENIPAGLEGYSQFLQSEVNSKWIKWQISGNEYLELSEQCPYCMSPTGEKKEQIIKVSKEYDSKSIEHLVKVIDAIESLGDYFSPDDCEKLKEITKNKIGLSKEEDAYLLRVKSQIELLKEKLIDLKRVTFFSFKEVSQVKPELEKLKIKLTLIEVMNSEPTRLIVDKCNKSIDDVISQAGQLQGKVNQQKAAIHRTIEKNKKEINDFLEIAGYKYLVDIVEDGNSYKMILKHRDNESPIANGSAHLSYGEKNAFSLVLFMYEVISNNPDLIILDDPISSFDKNKKFAIIEMLFRRKVSFMHKTVLMLTHDIDPVIDIISTLHDQFRPQPKASFIKTRSGITSEILINRSDLQTCTQVCKANLGSEINIINKLIYLRRYFEVIDNKGKEYQLLASLLHKRPVPTFQATAGTRDMTNEEIDSSSTTVASFIPDFSYSSILSSMNNKEEMVDLYNQATVGYDKLQLLRIINPQYNNSVLRKYINETFHIENDYIMQLNPSMYDVIPDFIIEECDKIING